MGVNGVEKVWHTLVSIARSCKFKIPSCDNFCLARIPELKFSTCFMSPGCFTDRCECGGR